MTRPMKLILVVLLGLCLVSGVVGAPQAAIKNIPIDLVGHTGLLYSSEAFDAIVKSILS